MKKPGLILIGGGGHCKSCIDVLEKHNEFSIAGIVDKNASEENLFGYKVFGDDRELPILKNIYDFALITVGQIKTPITRIELFDYAKSLGFIMPRIISPRAYVSKYAKVGEGTIIMHDALINAAAIVGSNSIINTKALIEHDALIGDHCHISTGAVINGGARVNLGTFIGSNSVVIGAAITKENDFIRAGSLFRGYVDD